jgi:hypothetical protein
LDEFVLYMGQTHFNYLKNSRGKINFITGDARINLAACEDEKFDIIVMDAFSGDTVPTHLITLEAIKSYKRKLKKQGIIIFHISSLYFDLSKPISAAAAETGFKCLVKKDIINPNPHVDPCKAIVLIKGETPGTLEYINKLEKKGFKKICENKTHLWKDSKVNILDILSFQ